MKQTGVYRIENVMNGHFYIGSTAKNLPSRWSEHRSLLNHGKHRNRLLQEDWNRYGESAFRFVVLEVLPKEDVLTREQELLNQFWGSENCYNLSSRAIPGGGRKLFCGVKAVSRRVSFKDAGFTTMNIYTKDAEIIARLYGKPMYMAFSELVGNCPHPEKGRSYLVARLPKAYSARRRRSTAGFYCQACDTYIFKETLAGHLEPMN